VLDVSKLSPLGFGCYRLSAPQHAEALQLALTLGCNLIDTAATYTAGQSERLVGTVLAANPDLDAFVVTKAGYGDDDHAPHCLSPDFLEARLDRSLERLRRPFADAFLLHNPEHMLDEGVSPDELREQLADAFVFLEKCVAAGRVRFYGVSSNVLATPPIGLLSLEGYLDLSRHVGDGHSFRFIQFPCNPLERAALREGSGRASLVARARARGVVTLANRPLNALHEGRLVRLAAYDGGDEELDSDKDMLLSTFVTLIGRQLARRGSNRAPHDFEVIRYIAEHFADQDATEAVDQLFGGFLAAFLRELYAGAVPQADAVHFARLRRLADQRVRQRMSERAAAVQRELIAERVLNERDDYPLQALACQFPLNAGVDHVLVGMRDTAYVRELYTCSGDRFVQTSSAA